MNGARHKVCFLRDNRTVEVDENTSLWDAALQAGLGFECCGVHPLCGLCRVAVREGEDALSSTTTEEEDLRRSFSYLGFERVACLTTVHGDVVVDLNF